MMNLACWAVPIRDGYVLRADRSTAAILQAAPARVHSSGAGALR